MKKSLLAKVISTLFMFLFSYSATGKIMNYYHFVALLNRSPIIMNYASLAWLVPAAESGTTLLLIFKTTRITGLIVSMLLMILFTGYLGFMISSDSSLQVLYNGVLQNSSLKTNMFFNLCFLVLATIGVLIQFDNIT